VKNEIIPFDINMLLPKARAALVKSCGFKDGSAKHRRMAQMADDVLQKGMEGLRPSAIVSAYDASVLYGHEATLDGTSFKCAAFARINPVHVKKIYVFIITAGEVSVEGGDVMDVLYADMWGTAFADAAIEALSELLADNTGSGSHIATFGPGFYGMDMSDIPLIFDILDGNAIGVEARAQSGCMIPLKSCAGFMIAADEPTALPPADCMSCVGNRGGCRLCKNNDK